MEWFLSFIISAAITAATYAAGPLLFSLLWNRKVSRRGLKGFCIVYTVIVCMAWEVFTYDGNGMSFAPAILWGMIFYRVAKSILKERQEVPAIPDQTPPAQRFYTCQKCGQLLPEGQPCDCEDVSEVSAAPEPTPESGPTPVPFPAPQPVPASPEAPLEVSVKSDPVETKPAKPHPKITDAQVAIIALSVLCVALIGAAGFLGCRLNETQQELERQKSALELIRKDRDSLQDRVTQLREKVNDLDSQNEELSGYRSDAIFFYNSVGFIVSGSSRYHSYECPLFHDADEYWAHNIEYCEYLGYSRCPKCWDLKTGNAKVVPPPLVINLRPSQANP